MSKPGDTVFVNCRRPKCTGQRCLVLRKFNLPTGGRSIHYRCLTCNGGFTITF